MGLALLAGAVSVSSCRKDDQPMDTIDSAVSLDKASIPAGFNFEMVKTKNFDLTFRSSDNSVARKVRVQFFDKPSKLGGELIFTAFTDDNGKIEMPVAIPTRVKNLVMETSAYGFPQDLMIPMSANNIVATIGGTNPTNLPNYEFNLPAPAAARTSGTLSAPYISTRLGTWNGVGVPNYLGPNQVVGVPFGTLIGSTLPESTNQTVARPFLFDGTYRHEILMTSTGSVNVTFLHEGAGYRNSLYYFKYHKNNPPATPGDIDSIIAVFPNASYLGGGGGLVSGNTVNIGVVGKDTIVGFAIATHGYNAGTNTIHKDFGLIYSLPALNTFAPVGLRQHMVLAWEPASRRFVFGFEDIRRKLPVSGDHDFNDVVFYATSTAIDSTDVWPLTPLPDCDNDGIPDSLDEYPCDGARAYNRNVQSHLAFEDLWPSVGDYDFNDLTIGNEYRMVLNANSRVVEMFSRHYIGGKGGALPHGFGISLGVPHTAIASVTGGEWSRGTTTRRPNGTEAGVNKATMIVYENAYDMLNGAVGNLINTIIGAPRASSDTLTMAVTLTSPQRIADFGDAPFNPFIFVQGRDREIHLPDMAPTEKHDATWFGKGKDTSNPGAGRYYKTSNGAPWAINIPEPFVYPKEYSAIQTAHLKFMDWVTSGGVNSTDWYRNLPGYRNPANIYTY